MWVSRLRAFKRLLWNRRDFQHMVENLSDEETRRSKYRELVDEYYDFCTDVYQLGWGDHFHFAPFYGEESQLEALLAQEEFLIEQVGVTSDFRVLDVGCGVGGPTCTIAQQTGAHVVGINICELQIEKARQRAAALKLADRVDFQLVDAMNMPFGDGSFDFVYGIESICHMPDEDRCYRECARVLKPGGTFAGWDWAIPRPPATDEERNDLEAICRVHAVPFLLTTDQVRTAIERQGFVVEKFEDLAGRGGPRKWWSSLEQRARTPIFFGMTWMKTMVEAARALTAAGKAGTFTPLCYWLAQKP